MMPRFERRVMALWKKSSARLRQSFLDENRQSAENDIAARFLMASFFHGYETMMRRASFFLCYQRVPMDNAALPCLRRRQ